MDILLVAMETYREVSGAATYTAIDCTHKQQGQSDCSVCRYAICLSPLFIWGFFLFVCLVFCLSCLFE